MAAQVGLEPTTLRLTAGCSTIELLRNGSHGRRSRPRDNNNDTERGRHLRWKRAILWNGAVCGQGARFRSEGAACEYRFVTESPAACSGAPVRPKIRTRSS